MYASGYPVYTFSVRSVVLPSLRIYEGHEDFSTVINQQIFQYLCACARVRKRGRHTVQCPLLRIVKCAQNVLGGKYTVLRILFIQNGNLTVFLTKVTIPSDPKCWESNCHPMLQHLSFLPCKNVDVFWPELKSRHDRAGIVSLTLFLDGGCRRVKYCHQPPSKPFQVSTGHITA